MKEVMPYISVVLCASLAWAIFRFDTPFGRWGRARVRFALVGLLLLALAPFAHNNVAHFGWGLGLIPVLWLYLGAAAVFFSAYIPYTAYQCVAKNDRGYGLELGKAVAENAILALIATAVAIGQEWG
jgi:hypothetical protein